MGVFDDDKIRRSPADCLLLPRTHLLEVAKKKKNRTHTRMWPHAHGHPLFFIVEELLALQGLKLQEQLILLTPCKPWRLCRESEPPCVHRGDGSGPSATLPRHIHRARPLTPPAALSCREGLLRWGFGAAWWSEICSAERAAVARSCRLSGSVNKMVEAKC